MRRHFLDEDAQPRFVQARIDAIRTIARIVAEQGCSFVVVSGDVWESNQLDRRTVGRALDALSSVPCPVYLLPGNHDPIDAGSVYRSSQFASRKPANVHVLDAMPVQASPGVELVGVPWPTKSPRRDLVAEVCGQLVPAPDVLRICAAHGIVDDLSPTKDDPALISRAGMDAAVKDGRIHFFALGDRHSATEVSDRIWYSGSPEATDHGETDSGRILIVDLAQDECNVSVCTTGRWRFVHETLTMMSSDDVKTTQRRLLEMSDKDVTILKVTLKGALSLGAKAQLDGILEEARALFGALQIWERHSELVVLPDDLDSAKLNLAGFAKSTLEDLQARANAGGEESVTARDALALLYRLTAGVAL